MSIVKIGDAVSSLRKMAGLSQVELARDICSQAQISKIESNIEVPSSIILFEISKKLGVDMNYFFEFSETPRLDYLEEVKQLITRLKKQRDYKGIKNAVDSEFQNPLFQRVENKQILLWHRAICYHYLDGESEKAIEHLYRALYMTYDHNKSFYRETEIEILNSIAIILKDLERYEEAESIFRQCLNMFLYTPKYDINIQIKLIYGLSKLLTDIGKYVDSKKLCQEGIELCKKQGILFLFGELLYQLGSNYARMGQEKEAIVAFDKSEGIFDAQDNHNLLDSVRQLRKDLLK